MPLEVVKKGDKRLIERCEKQFITLSVEEIEEIKQTMIINKGVGLASNQIGRNERFFVAVLRKRFGVFINPSIIGHGKEEIVGDEGCLSILDDNDRIIFKPKKRYAVLNVQYWDENKNFHRDTVKRFNARIFQHEMDHLNGKLCQ